MGHILHHQGVDVDGQMLADERRADAEREADA